MTTTESTSQTASPSIGDLRSMLSGETPAEAAEPSKAEAQSVETPAGTEAEAAAEPETDQGSDPEATGEDNRGPDGKFTAKDEGETSPGVQKRIDKAVRAQREAERRAQEAERRLAEISQGSRPATEHAPQAASDLKMEDFPDVNAYFRAVAERTAAEAGKAQAEALARAEQQRAQDALQASHLARVEAAKTKYDDYESTIEAAQSLDISQELVQQILHSDHGPDVAYYLAKNPAELKRIMALPQVRHAAEFGKLETRFTSPPPKPQPKPLPKPAATVGGSGSVKEPDLHDRNIDMGTFKRLAQARLAG